MHSGRGKGELASGIRKKLFEITVIRSNQETQCPFNIYTNILRLFSSGSLRTKFMSVEAHLYVFLLCTSFPGKHRIYSQVKIFWRFVTASPSGQVSERWSIAVWIVIGGDIVRGSEEEKNIGKQGNSMSNELPRMDIMAAGDLGEYHVSFVSILQSALHVRWQSRLDYA